LKSIYRKIIQCAVEHTYNPKFLLYTKLTRKLARQAKKEAERDAKQ